jgi:signal transduction histidine kinase
MAGLKGRNLLEQALPIALASGRSNQARLNGLLRLAVRAHGLSSASLFLPDANLDALTQRFSTLLPLSGSSCHVPYGAGCSGRAAARLTPEHSSLDQLLRDEPFITGENSFLALPVVDGKRLVAILFLGSKEASMPKEAVSGCRSLGPLFAGVVAGLTAAERATRMRCDLSLIASLAQILTPPQSIDTLLPKLLRLVTGSPLARCAVIRLSAGETKKQRFFQSCHQEERAALPDMLLAESALSTQVSLTPSSINKPVPLLNSTYYAFCTPLGCNGSIFGTMTFFGRREPLSPDQSELVKTVVRLISSALGEAISAQRILNFDSENSNKLKELSLLYRMSNTMLSTIKLNKLIHLTLTALTSGPTPFFDRAMLFLSNERSGVLLGMLGVTRESSPPMHFHNGGDDILSSRWDISSDDMAAQRESEFCREVLGMRLNLDDAHNVASQAVIEKRLIHIPGDTDRQGSGTYHKRNWALAATPLLAHGKAVGAVMVDNALSGAPISQEDLRFLQLFTNQAGMAIENSMLFHKLEDTHRQLSEVQENLLQKERLAAIGEMAAGIAHELKGPLVSIGGFAGRLTKKLHHESPEWGHADLIVREVQRLEGILSEILLFSKKPTICYARCSISDIVKDSLAVVGPPIEEKQITVSIKWPRKELQLLVDGQQLKQVFINIIMNALDAMGTGGKLSIQVSTGELDGKESVCVKISDTGGGIPIEALGSIFTPFYTTKDSGTGLGLPIANRIITNHGGKIQVTNNPGKGVEFRVILPKHW